MLALLSLVIDLGMGPAYTAFEPHVYEDHGIYWQEERKLHTMGHVSIGLEGEILYVEAYHDSIIGEKDAGTDGIRAGVRFKFGL